MRIFTSIKSFILKYRCIHLNSSYYKQKLNQSCLELSKTAQTLNNPLLFWCLHTKYSVTNRTTNRVQHHTHQTPKLLIPKYDVIVLKDTFPQFNNYLILKISELSSIRRIILPDILLWRSSIFSDDNLFIIARCATHLHSPSYNFFKPWKLYFE